MLAPAHGQPTLTYQGRTLCINQQCTTGRMRRAVVPSIAAQTAAQAPPQRAASLGLPLVTVMGPMGQDGEVACNRPRPGALKQGGCSRKPDGLNCMLECRGRQCRRAGDSLWPCGSVLRTAAQIAPLHASTNNRSSAAARTNPHTDLRG